jgi:hypothetical protein
MGRARPLVGGLEHSVGEPHCTADLVDMEINGDTQNIARFATSR